MFEIGLCHDDPSQSEMATREDEWVWPDTAEKKYKEEVRTGSERRWMYIQEISGTAILNFTGDLILDLSLPTVIKK